MVYLRITPFGLWGGSQDTTTLLEEEGTALMPAGGPGTIGKTKEHQQSFSRACVCVCVCWVLLAIQVSRLVSRLLVLSRTKPLWEDLEELPFGGRW